jgi:carboxymethylenebutenolidase
MREPHETPAPGALERLWAEHLAGEFEAKDVEATLATMVPDAYVNHVPVGTGGRGQAALRAFYRDDFIPSWPGDLVMTLVNRVVGAGKLVDELRLRFTHGDKLSAERIYWDHASVLRQAGLWPG